jgi:hypothetical protein
LLSRFFIASGFWHGRGTREIIVERREPPHYGVFETLASSSKDMPTHPDYASAAKRFVVKGIETTIDG